MGNLGTRFLVFSFLLIMISSVLVTSPETLAQTPRIQGQGTAASGMGNAFMAQADDPSALHYNPAGMTQLRGVQNMFGALFIGGTTNFTSAANGRNVTGDRGASVAWPPPGHIYLTANLGDIGFKGLERWTAGVGMNSPNGSLTRWPNDGPFASVVTFNTQPLLDIKPTLAYKLNDQFSFGAGLDIYTFTGLFGEGHVEVKTSPTPGTEVELNGSGTGVGFNVGMMYTPLRNAEGKPLANVALVYRSQATVPLSGEMRVNGALVDDAKATLFLPSVISAGIALWPVRDETHEWKLEVDVDHVGWKNNRNLDVSRGNGTTIPSPRNWRNAYNVMIGTEYKWLKLERLPEWEVALRAGYTHQQTQMPDQTFNPGIPSADTHIPGVGLGITCKENGYLFGRVRCGDLGIGPLKYKAIGLDLSYQVAIYEPRTVTCTAAGPPVCNTAINGRYDTLIHVGGASIRFIF